MTSAPYLHLRQRYRKLGVGPLFGSAIVLAAVMCIGIQAGESSSIRDLNEMPCGVLCTTAFLRLSGHTIAYERVRQAFEKRRGDADLKRLSFADLTDVLRSFSLNTRAYSFDLSAPADRIPAPAILFVRPRADGTSSDRVGHFVLLERIDASGNAHVLDFTNPRLRVRVPTDGLSRFWDGRLLIAEKPSHLRWLAVGLSGVNLSIMVVLLAMSFLTPRARKSVARSAVKRAFAD